MGGFPHSALKSFSLYYTSDPVDGATVPALVDEILRPQRDSLEKLVIRNGLRRCMEDAGRPVQMMCLKEIDIFGPLNEVALLVQSIKLNRDIKTLALDFCENPGFAGSEVELVHLVDSLGESDLTNGDRYTNTLYRLHTQPL